MSMTQESSGERQAPSMTNKGPSTLSELRKRIAHDLCDKREPFKSCMERAERSRKEGKDYSNLDPGRAFVAFARAGYLLLVTLPMHPHYKLLLRWEKRREMLHDGQDILRKLIVLKRRIFGRQNELWAIMDAYPGSPAERSLPSFSRQGTGVTPHMRDVFREKTDYRSEFEQLLGGKVEDTTTRSRSRNISSPQITPVPSMEGHRSSGTGRQNDNENGPTTEGIEVRVPKRSLSPSASWQRPLFSHSPNTSFSTAPTAPGQFPKASPHRRAVNHDQAGSESCEVSRSFSLEHRPPHTSFPPVPPNTTKRNLRHQHNNHYYQPLKLDSKSRNANPINFEIKRRMKSRREAHRTNSTSESSTTFDTVSFVASHTTKSAS